MNLNKLSVLPIIMIIAGGVLYHVSQKATPRTIDPFLSLALSFGLASAACFTMFLSRGIGITSQLRELNWTSFVLAIALVAIESGYLIGYRAGYRLNLTSFICNNLIAVVLVLVAATVYREKFTLRDASGALLCLAGLFLLR